MNDKNMDNKNMSDKNMSDKNMDNKNMNDKNIFWENGYIHRKSFYTPKTGDVSRGIDTISDIM